MGDSGFGTVVRTSPGSGQKNMLKSTLGASWPTRGASKRPRKRCQFWCRTKVTKRGRSHRGSSEWGGGPPTLGCTPPLGDPRPSLRQPEPPPKAPSSAFFDLRGQFEWGTHLLYPRLMLYPSLNSVLVWCCVSCVDVAVDNDDIVIHVRILESFLIVGTLKSLNSVLVWCYCV